MYKCITSHTCSCISWSLNNTLNYTAYLTTQDSHVHVPALQHVTPTKPVNKCLNQCAYDSKKKHKMGLEVYLANVTTTSLSSELSSASTTDLPYFESLHYIDYTVKDSCAYYVYL